MLRRLLQLFIGLTLYGVSTAMFVRADLGADPWNVFHLGVAEEYWRGDHCRGCVGTAGVDTAAPASRVWHVEQRDYDRAGGRCRAAGDSGI